MIVRPAFRSLLLITQPDHARLAGRIMEAWTGLDAATRPGSLRTAISEHDNGWREVDAAPILDGTGRILDFIHAPAEVRQGVWPRGVSRLAADPWAAALVAQHAITVYDSHLGDPEWAGFFSSMTTLRDEHVLASGLSLDQLLRDYVFVRLGDLASLTFCNRWTDAHQFGGYTISLSDSSLIVTPDPFNGRAVEFTIEGRELSDEPFRTPDAAREAFLSAPRVTLRGVAVGRF